MHYIALFLLVLSSCGPKPSIQQSPLDTAANQYQRGLISLERGDYLGAQRAFERARMLDGDFPGVYVGYALVAMSRDDFFRAHKNLELALHKDNDFVDAHIARGRLITREGIAGGRGANSWLPDALRAFKEAEAIDGTKSSTFYYRGQSYLEAHKLALARAEYTRIIEINRGPYVAPAMDKVEKIQMVERAAPGTEVGIKIGLVEEITRAELAVLLLEEMNIAELIDKRRPSSGASGFAAPNESQSPARQPTDIAHSWAKPWIEDILALGVPGLELSAGESFLPDEPLTRANYAMVNQGILVLLTGDPSLTTRYIGESSRFPDVRGDFYAYNAIALSTERGFMEVDKRTGSFYPNRTVSGAEALAMIRELQNSFRIEF